MDAGKPPPKLDRRLWGAVEPEAEGDHTPGSVKPWFEPPDPHSHPHPRPHPKASLHPHQVGILRGLQHDHIVQLLGVSASSRWVFMVMQVASPSYHPRGVALPSYHPWGFLLTPSSPCA